jgi:transcriptional regulator of arginine metabolism
MHADRPQSDRRDNILRHLRAGAVRRQSDLVKLLKKDGFDVTQSSVSRDMRELGVLKAQGRYLPPGEEVSQAQGNFSAIDRFVRDIRTAGPSIIVIRTSVGAAGSVAVAIDKAAWPEAVGTISGDDTIFIATQDGRAQAALLDRLRSVFRI